MNMAPLFPAIPDNGKNSSPMGNSQKIGVVLFQLGGPDSLDAVEPFLYNLFSDPDIIDFPFAKLAREPLARLMASWRAKKVSGDYGIIGRLAHVQDIRGPIKTTDHIPRRAARVDSPENAG